jgi:hypothetical protein
VDASGEEPPGPEPDGGGPEHTDADGSQSTVSGSQEAGCTSTSSKPDFSTARSWCRSSC